MNLSVLDLVPVYSNASSTDALTQALLLAKVAEKLGYTRYWVAEHHDMQGLACTAPEVLLSHVGAQTSSIRLGTGALLLPHYKPIKVAETFNMLAALYPGRIDLGIGRAPGGSAHVSMALSGNFLENVWRIPQSLRELSELLLNQYEMDGNPVTARPIPPSPPDVWLLGTNNKTASYAAEFGTGYVFGQFMSDRDGTEVISSYRHEFKASSFSKAPRVILAIGIVCAESMEEANSLAAAGYAWIRPGEADGEGEPVSNNRVIVGTPGQIKARLEELQSLNGVDEFLVVTMVQDYQKRFRSYELLAESIL
jgi:luciferase family oxidoreductase group 1